MTDAGENGRRTETHTLSTGHTVRVPLTLDARITGAVFAAPLDGLSEMLPSGLRPLRAGPGSGLVTVLSVDYERVGDGAVAPYDELCIQIPTVKTGASSVPLLSALRRCTSGYVWYMPVTTDPARALGEEVWGYPKAVADISIAHGTERTRTTVTVDGERLLTMTVARPPTAPLRLRGYSYTEREGTLLRERTTIAGDVGGWPLSDRVALDLGSHPRARRLRGLDLGGRAVLRLAADCRFQIGSGRPA